MASRPCSRACVVIAAVAMLAGCRQDRSSPEDDAFAGAAGASPSATGRAAAPAPAAGSATPSRDAAELEIHAGAEDEFDIEMDVTIAVQIDLRSGALPLTKLPTGYRLDAAPDGSLPARLGLKPGDELISLNDVLLLDAAAADRAYQQGLSDGRFMLLLKRAGEQRSVQYRLKLSGRDGSLRALRARERRQLARSRRLPGGSGGALAGIPHRAPFDDVVVVLKGGVKAAGSNSFELDRHLLTLFESHPRLLRRRVYPSKLHGGGARAASSFDSALTAMGLHRGDIVQHVAGEPVTSPEQLAKALSAAGKLSSFSMSVHRADAGQLDIKYVVVTGLLDKAAADEALKGWSGGLSSPLSRALAARPPRPPGSRPPSPRPSRLRPSSLAMLDIREFVSVDPTQVMEVRSEALTRILADRRAMLTDMRVRPVYKDGKEIGMMISGIRERSPAHVLGFRNGDVIKTVDGRKLYTLRTFVRALQRAPLRVPVVVALERKGSAMTLRYRRL